MDSIPRGETTLKRFRMIRLPRHQKYVAAFHIGIAILMIALFPVSAQAHEDGGSQDHGADWGWIGKTALAEGDTLTFSINDTHCSIKYYGKNDMGFEIEISLYTTDQFDEVRSERTYLVQSGETFEDHGIAWRILEKPDGNIILAHVKGP